MVVVGLMQVAKLKEAVQKEDPSAFMILSDAAEVIGQGFTMPLATPKTVNAAIERSIQNGPISDSIPEQPNSTNAGK